MPAALKAPTKEVAVKRAARQVPQFPFDRKLVLQQYHPNCEARSCSARCAITTGRLTYKSVA